MMPDYFVDEYSQMRSRKGEKNAEKILKALYGINKNLASNLEDRIHDACLEGSNFDIPAAELFERTSMFATNTRKTNVVVSITNLDVVDHLNRCKASYGDLKKAVRSVFGDCDISIIYVEPTIVLNLI